MSASIFAPPGVEEKVISEVLFFLWFVPPPFLLEPCSNALSYTFSQLATFLLPKHKWNFISPHKENPSPALLHLQVTLSSSPNFSKKWLHQPLSCLPKFTPLTTGAEFHPHILNKNGKILKGHYRSFRTSLPSPSLHNICHSPGNSPWMVRMSFCFCLSTWAFSGPTNYSLSGCCLTPPTIQIDITSLRDHCQ